MTLGKMIFGFLIVGLCIVGTMMIFAQQTITPIGGVNIGNTDVYTNTSSIINQTAGLVSQTSSYGTTVAILILFIIGALILISAIALISGRKS